MALDETFADLDPATVAVRDLVGASRELTGRMASLMGMNPNDMSAIGALTLGGPMGVADLARHLSIRSASATAMVDRLEQAGHVVRTRDSDDRRRVTVTETPAARKASFEAWAPTIGAIDAVCRDLGEDDRAVVCAFLRQITAIVEGSG
ncbi:MarR family winged helix-turn-helix transcriptional regulator [Williamsia deligens]|uniref:MarR family winged helix-turn-helix transcriptional regulator n=1 Tax=Williamsia deligens TaxID=321325 RepID=A0ABW3G4P2_9NOCA|nr:MarR family winged helix-turn-helix transcriptional regulator [Williamsia deligens]MCP2193657.1 DNA-binding transcriptional regulator, MarR family [Williamsia deligens]